MRVELRTTFQSLPTQDVSKRAIVTDWSEKSYFPLDGVPMDARIRSVGYWKRQFGRLL